ncbi:hypothetical protein G7046_g4855 [Stylonectria norvegica]|nr:hypothetical protein G7046_g4855 [Stylonectria norvegica]
MHPSPHPNQVRSACERCRRQKLRCLRQTASEPSCSRCTRLNLPCQSGPQRRVGRPPKRGLVPERSGAVAVADADPAAELVFLEGLLDDQTPDLAWNLASPSVFEEMEDIVLPMDHWLPAQDYEALPRDQYAIIQTNPQFDTLSHLNLEIYKMWDMMTTHGAKMSFEEFVCVTTSLDGVITTGIGSIQRFMRCMQEFLVVIKALHRRSGTRSVPKPRYKPQSAAPHRLMLTSDPCLSPAAPPEDLSSNSTTCSSSTLDSPTMFLVVSCYVQIIQYLELLLQMVHARLADTTIVYIEVGPMDFADVALIETSSQFALFCELVSHLLRQINLVVGLPSACSDRSIWTGLLKEQRYREMVNAELGAVEIEGGWTTRPGRLMDMTRAAKDLLEETSAMGF